MPRSKRIGLPALFAAFFRLGVMSFGGGTAGWPLGKKPFIKEGPNKIEFYLRNQVRYEWFHYLRDAKGVLVTVPFASVTCVVGL